MVTCMARSSSKRAIKELSTHIKYLIDRCFNPFSIWTVHKKVAIIDQPTVTMNGRDGEVTVDEVPMQWEVEVEDGVIATFVSQPGGSNLLKKIRFSEELFNPREAKTWWTQNSDKLMELYTVQRSCLPNQDGVVRGPCRAGDSLWGPPYSDVVLANESPVTSSSMPEHEVDQDHDSDDSMHTSRMKLSSTTDDTSSTTEASKSSTESDDGIDEWEEQDEPGVSVTIRSYPDGTREIRHVNLSRERFDEATARAWWADNKARLHDRYVVFFVF
ncbi:protein Brevis radix-like 4 isoform X2 [Magnolia sinica]|uniref:protein Brevis radix-like 4 isoform X2 n=1 Tax=Magnolia sinica TaxID=86752 RepID=UPI00265822D8|nr:protein Brevis radix-like 4 isoform X2 [Magnolia sinica]